MECIVARNQKDYEAGITKIFLPEDYIRFMEQEEQKNWGFLTMFLCYNYNTA